MIGQTSNPITDQRTANETYGPTYLSPPQPGDDVLTSFDFLSAALLAFLSWLLHRYGTRSEVDSDSEEHMRDQWKGDILT